MFLSFISYNVCSLRDLEVEIIIHLAIILSGEDKICGVVKDSQVKYMAQEPLKLYIKMVILFLVTKNWKIKP